MGFIFFSSYVFLLCSLKYGFFIFTCFSIKKKTRINECDWNLELCMYMQSAPCDFQENWNIGLCMSMYCAPCDYFSIFYFFSIPGPDFVFLIFQVLFIHILSIIPIAKKNQQIILPVCKGGGERVHFQNFRLCIFFSLVSVFSILRGIVLKWHMSHYSPFPKFSNWQR